MIIEDFFVDCNFSVKLKKEKQNNTLLNGRVEKLISWLLEIMSC